MLSAEIKNDEIRYSIIIPCYNVAQIADKLHGMYCRDLCVPYEVIFVDDCSSDGSYEILLENSHCNDNVVVVRTDRNGGPGVARNVGLKYASGDYILFCDSDDECDISILERLFGQIDNCDLIVSPYTSSRGGKKKEVDLYCDFDSNVDRMFVAKNDGTPWGKIYRRSIIDKNGISFPERMTGEDKVFLVNYLVHSNIIRKIGESFYTYVNNKQSVTHKKSGADISLPTTFEILKKIYHEHFPEIEIEMFVNSHLMTKAKQMTAQKYSCKQIRDWFKKENMRYPNWIDQIEIKSQSIYRKLFYKAMAKSNAFLIKCMLKIREWIY